AAHKRQLPFRRLVPQRGGHGQARDFSAVLAAHVHHVLVPLAEHQLHRWFFVFQRRLGTGVFLLLLGGVCVRVFFLILGLVLLVLILLLVFGLALFFLVFLAILGLFLLGLFFLDTLRPEGNYRGGFIEPQVGIT